MLIVEKFPWANTLDVTRGVEAALDELRPGLPGIADRHRRSSGRRTSSTLAIAQPDACAAPRLAARAAGAGAVPVRVAHRADQPGRDPAVAAGRRRWSCTLRGATINTMVLAGLVIAVGVVVDDAIIDIENIVRRLRQAPAGATAPPLGERRHPRGLARGAQRDHLRDADRRRGAAADPLHARACRAPSSGRWPSPTGWRCSRRWSSR